MVMNRRHGKEEEYGQNKTENHNSKYTIIYKKDTVYVISKSRSMKQTYVAFRSKFTKKN